MRLTAGSFWLVLLQDKPVRTPPLTDLEKMHLKYSAKTPFKKGGSFAKVSHKHACSDWLVHTQHMELHALRCFVWVLKCVQRAATNLPGVYQTSHACQAIWVLVVRQIAPAPLVKGAKKELAAVAVEDDIPAEVQVTL